MTISHQPSSALRGLPAAVDLAFATLGRGTAHTIDALPDERAALGRLCSTPAFRPLLDGVRLSVVPNLDTPFKVPDGVTVAIASATISATPAAYAHLHHALQLALWQRLVPGRTLEDRIVLGVLACAAAVAQVKAMRAPDAGSVCAQGPDWFASLVLDRATNVSRGGGTEVEIAMAIAARWPKLLPLQGVQAEPEVVEDGLIERAAMKAAPLLAVALPSDLLLTSGGDSRLVVDPEAGLNKYGCGAAPRPEAITFSSCTASSPSDLGYATAEHVRQVIATATLEAGEADGPFADAMETLRAGLADLFELRRLPGSELLLAASGTDCELFALHFALAYDEAPLLNIVIAPDEIGSGSLPAARGLHFDKAAPLGGDVRPGESVGGLPVSRLRVTSVDVRDEQGTPRSGPAIDAEVERLVLEALGRGERVLLHMVDSSKTGLRAPTLGLVTRLRQQHGPRVMVLVDQAQMRTGLAALQDRLAAGFMIIVSGSKFYTGPAFSGALLVPPDVAAQVDRLASWPNGFEDYLSTFEVPARWKHLGGLRARRNVGLLLRWRAALWEMEAFRAAGASAQLEYLARFEREVRDVFARYPFLDLVEAPIGERSGLPGEPAWDQVSTIFTFTITPRPEDRGGDSPLGYDACWEMYTLLNRDLTAHLPVDATEAQRRLAARACHLGQPVRIRQDSGASIGALRIASGARLVSRVAFDPTLGSDVEARLATQTNGVESVLDKIALVLDLRRLHHLA